MRIGLILQINKQITHFNIQKTISKDYVSFFFCSFRGANAIFITEFSERKLSKFGPMTILEKFLFSSYKIFIDKFIDIRDTHNFSDLNKSLKIEKKSKKS